MRKKLLIGLGVFAGLLLILVVVVAMQPDDFVVTRSTTIAAPPGEVFPHVNDLHKWQGWSPWAERDPNAKATFEGPDAGEGAKFHWAGNDEVGEGEMTIVESQPDKLVSIDLHFIKPFEDTAKSEFTFQPQGEETLVTWTMSGKSNFIGKAMCLFMNMDEMVGGDFEKGLANLTREVAKSSSTDTEVETTPAAETEATPTEETES